MSKIKHSVIPNAHIHPLRGQDTTTRRARMHRDSNAGGAIYPDGVNKWVRSRAAQISFDGLGTPFNMVAPIAFTTITPVTVLDADIDMDCPVGGAFGTAGLIEIGDNAATQNFVTAIGFGLCLSHTDAAAQLVYVKLFMGAGGTNASWVRLVQPGEKWTFQGNGFHVNNIQGVNAQMQVQVAVGNIDVHWFYMNADTDYNTNLQADPL